MARLQEYFVGKSSADALLPVNTKRFEFGLNYYFIDGLKASTNFGREFSAQGNANVWTMTVTYRFVFTMGRAGN